MGDRWSDRDELLELLGRYTDMPDLPDWDTLPSQVFAHEVEWDVSSLGAPAAVVDRGLLVERLRKAFAGWEATHHVASAHQIPVDGGQATIHAKICAEHWLPVSETGDSPTRWLAGRLFDTASNDRNGSVAPAEPIATTSNTSARLNTSRRRWVPTLRNSNSPDTPATLRAPAVATI